MRKRLILLLMVIGIAVIGIELAILQIREQIRIETARQIFSNDIELMIMTGR